MPTNKLGRWFRRHSLTLVAALGGAAGVAYAAGWHRPAEKPPMPQVQPAAAAEPVRDTVVDTVQIALLLDTSSSMNGLINQARSHLWNMVDQMGKMTRVVDGKIRGVKIELALYEYGNSTIPAEAGYIRQVLPLSGDLDKVSASLHSLFTNGGSEYAGQAIQTAATKLQWSSDPNALKFIYIAGNEEFDQGPVSAADAMAAAEKSGISVQLILCDNSDPTWASAAKLAKSDLATIDQNQVAVHIPSPQDAEILRLGDELNGTYMAYGAEGQAAVARQKGADVSSAKLSKKVAIERAQLKSKRAYKNDSWDVVDAVETNGKFLETAGDEKLPEVMRGKTLDEKKQIVAANAAKRAEIKAKIGKLEAERAAFVEAERKKLGGPAEQSLDTELMKSTKKVATKKGYKL